MRSSLTRAAMITVSAVVFVCVAFVSAVFFAEGDDFNCRDGWFVVSELLLVGSLAGRPGPFTSRSALARSSGSSPSSQ